MTNSTVPVPLDGAEVSRGVDGLEPSMQVLRVATFIETMADDGNLTANLIVAPYIYTDESSMSRFLEVLKHVDLLVKPESGDEKRPVEINPGSLYDRVVAESTLYWNNQSVAFNSSYGQLFPRSATMAEATEHTCEVWKQLYRQLDTVPDSE